MNIQVNTDNHTDGHRDHITYFKGVIENSLYRISEHMTRLEVHLNNEKGDKSGQSDKRCMIEARVQGRKPVAVTNHAATFEQAVDGALDKLLSMDDGIHGREAGKRNDRVDLPLPGQELTELS